MKVTTASLTVSPGNRAYSLGFTDLATTLHDFDVNDQRIARQDWLAPLDGINRHEVGDLSQFSALPKVRIPAT